MDSKKMTIRIGTRASDLALFQTRLFQSALNLHAPSEIKKVTTRGDIDQRAFLNIQGDGFFTKELENRLLNNEVDFAVHSCKDLASTQHQNLSWQAFSHRESVYDILIIHPEFVLSENPLKLREDSLIGTSSPRRTAQANIAFQNVKIENLRGNVPTRIQKVIDKKYAGIILAEAGVQRLQLEEMILSAGLKIYQLPFVTAPGQGILAVQTTKEHSPLLQKVSNPPLTELALMEKEILALLGGGCHLACGAHFQKQNSTFILNFFLKDETGVYNFNISDTDPAIILRKLFKNLTNQKNAVNRVILTQPIQNQFSTARTINNYGFESVPWVLTEVRATWNIDEVRAALDSNFDCLVFSSQFGARIFFQDLIYAHPELAQKIKDKPAICIGKKTAICVENTGLKTIVSPMARAESQALELRDYKCPLLVTTCDSILAQELTKTGKNYKLLPVYKSFSSHSCLSHLPPLKTNDTLVLTSPGIAQEFLNFCLKDPTVFEDIKNKNIKIVAFGPSTSKVLEQHQVAHTTNPKPGSWEFLLEYKY